MNKLMEKNVWIECSDEKIKEKFNQIIADIGLQICSKIDEIDYYCYISPAIGFNYEDCQLIEIFNIEEIAENMKKSKKGKMIYITSSIINNTNINEKYAKASAIEKYNLALWMNIAIKMARYSINCNVIEVGFNDLFFDGIKNKTEYARRLLNRRMVTENDILSAIKLLFSEHSSYMVGSTIKLDGGISLGVIAEKKDVKLNEIKEAEGALSNSCDLQGKRIIVFGSSSGIGRAIAKELSSQGAELILLARREKKLMELKHEIGKDCVIISDDVTNKEKMEKVLEEIWNKKGTINGIVYSVGQGYLVDDLDYQDKYLKMNNVNFEGYMNVCQIITKKWIKEKVKGSIVAISTVDIERIPSIGLGCYSVTKASLTQYTKNYALSSARYGIRANCVMPGYIETEMLDWTAESYRERWKERIPLHRLGKSEDVAGVVAYLLGDCSSYVSGSNIVIDGGYMLNDISSIL